MNKRSTSLILMRGIPLALRPLVISLEGFIVSESVLTIVIPAAMILLSLSSIPIHRKLYIQGLNRTKEYCQYISNLTVICIIFLLIVSPVVLLLIFHNENTTINIAILIIVMWLVEKISDEESRRLEYQKRFTRWFLIQLVRSGWPLVSILFYLILHFDWVESLQIMGLSLVLVFTGVFLKYNYQCIKWKNVEKKDIKDGFYLIVGSIIPSIAINIPRLQVALHFVDFANFYLATSQVMAMVPVLYDVIFSIRRRKLISRKPRKYLNIISKINLRILYFSISTFVFIVLFFVFFKTHIDYNISLFIFMFLLFVEALIYTLLNCNLNIIFWEIEVINAFRFYLIVIAAVVLFYFVAFKIVFQATSPFIFIPSVSIVTLLFSFILTTLFLKK